MNIYQYDSSGFYTGLLKEIQSSDPAPKGWTRSGPPSPQGDLVPRWQAGRWSLSAREEPTVVYKDFTSLEYLDMFTESEQLAVVNATMTVPQVKLWYDRMLAASFVTYADPRTDAGLQALVTAGLITEARKAEIVSELTAT